MFSKIIYEKTFPEDPILEALKQQESADLFNEEQAQYPSFRCSSHTADLQHKSDGKK